LKYKQLFFDLDRTLWDYDTNSSLALGEVYAEFGLDRHFGSPEEFIALYNHHNDFLWDQYRQGNIKKMELRTKRFLLTLQEKNLSDGEMSEAMGDRYMYITPRLNTLAPNTIETLEYLSGLNYKMYILTNGFLSTQEKKMASSEIDRYFIKIYSSALFQISQNEKSIGYLYYTFTPIFGLPGFFQKRSAAPHRESESFPHSRWRFIHTCFGNLH